MRRLAAIILCCSPLLVSCGTTTSESGMSAFVADHWPHWAGGMPDDVPPRPGAPGYNQFIAHGENAADAAAPSGPTPEFVQTGSSSAPNKVVKPAKPGTPRATQARQQPPQQEPPQQEPAAEPQGVEDTSVTKGGLY